MKFYHILTIIAVLFLASCASSKALLTETLTGSWQAEKIRIKMNGVRGTEKDSVVIMEQSDFKEIMGFDGNYAKYKENGDYTMIYTGISDTVTLKITGKWHIEGDSLIIDQITPQERTMTYELKSKKGKAIMNGLIDFDNDGIEDDELTIVATKMEPGTFPKVK